MGKLNEDHINGSDVSALMIKYVKLCDLARKLERAERGGITRDGCDSYIAESVALMHGSDYSALIEQLRKWAEKGRDSHRIVITKTLNESPPFARPPHDR